jgi:hypothetical protein
LDYVVQQVYEKHVLRLLFIELQRSRQRRECIEDETESQRYSVTEHIDGANTVYRGAMALFCGIVRQTSFRLSNILIATWNPWNLL